MITFTIYFIINFNWNFTIFIIFCIIYIQIVRVP